MENSGKGANRTCASVVYGVAFSIDGYACDVMKRKRLPLPQPFPTTSNTAAVDSRLETKFACGAGEIYCVPMLIKTFKLPNSTRTKTIPREWSELLEAALPPPRSPPPAFRKILLAGSEHYQTGRAGKSYTPLFSLSLYFGHVLEINVFFLRHIPFHPKRKSRSIYIYTPSLCTTSNCK